MVMHHVPSVSRFYKNYYPAPGPTRRHLFYPSLPANSRCRSAVPPVCNSSFPSDALSRELKIAINQNKNI